MAVVVAVVVVVAFNGVGKGPFRTESDLKESLRIPKDLRSIRTKCCCCCCYYCCCCGDWLLQWIGLIKDRPDFKKPQSRAKIDKTRSNKMLLMLLLLLLWLVVAINRINKGPSELKTVSGHDQERQKRWNETLLLLLVLLLLLLLPASSGWIDYNGWLLGEQLMRKSPRGVHWLCASLLTLGGSCKQVGTNQRHQQRPDDGTGTRPRVLTPTNLWPLPSNLIWFDFSLLAFSLFHLWPSYPHHFWDLTRIFMTSAWDPNDPQRSQYHLHPWWIPDGSQAD